MWVSQPQAAGVLKTNAGSTVKPSDWTESEAPPSNSSSYPSCPSATKTSIRPGDPPRTRWVRPGTGNPVWTDVLGLLPNRRRKIPVVIVVFTRRRRLNWKTPSDMAGFHRFSGCSAAAPATRGAVALCHTKTSIQDPENGTKTAFVTKTAEGNSSTWQPGERESYCNNSNKLLTTM